mgnify:CR=1 FL=1
MRYLCLLSIPWNTNTQVVTPTSYFSFHASANKENATPSTNRNNMLLSPSTTSAGSKLPLSSSASKSLKGSKAASPNAAVNGRNCFDSPTEDFSELMKTPKAIHMSDANFNTDYNPHIADISPVDFTKMQYDDLYMVAINQKKDLQSLREFCNLEKGMWSEEVEIKRHLAIDEEKLRMGIFLI